MPNQGYTPALGAAAGKDSTLSHAGPWLRPCLTPVPLTGPHPRLHRQAQALAHPGPQGGAWARDCLGAPSALLLAGPDCRPCPGTTHGEPPLLLAPGMPPICGHCTSLQLSGIVVDTAMRWVGVAWKILLPEVIRT